jgi:uncharacterized membrane protein YbhN (UPF0104 family)
LEADLPAKPARRRLPVWLTLSLKILFAAILLYLVFTHVPFAETLRAMRDSDAVLCLLAYLLIIPAHVLTGVQMWAGFRAQNIPHRMADLIQVQFAAMFYGLVIPGDVSAMAVKWIRLSKGGRHLAETAAIILYCRVVNSLGLLCLGLIALPFEEQLDSALLRALVGGAFLLSLAAFLPFFSGRAALAMGRLGRGLAARLPLPGVVRVKSGKVWDGVVALSRLPPASRLWLAFLGFAFQALGILSLWVLARALDLPLGLLACAWISLLLYIVTLAPISVAGLGLREATLVHLLPTYYGIGAESALALSLLVFGRRLFLCLVGGVWEGLRWLYPSPKPRG